MTILHRVLRWVPHSDNKPERIEYEADPRHREVLSLQLGLADGKTRSVTSLFEKIKITPDTERELQESEVAVFRSAVMRLGFLALDRPDIQFGATEAARGMVRPTVRHQRMLKRCARYLLQARTLTWCCARTTISAVYPGEVGYRLGRMPTYPTKHKRHISTFRTAHLVLQQHNASACLSVFRWSRNLRSDKSFQQGDRNEKSCV